MSSGSLRPVSGAAIAIWAVIGLVGGWALHPIWESWRGVAPVVTWVQPLVLYLIAAILGGTAWITWRQLHVHRTQIEPHRAVNRLVLARACTLVGALLAGGYLGYAVSWLGYSGDPLAHERLLRSVLAGVAGILVTVAARLLEHACRVHEDEDEDE
ncbi:DUF3180 domain-containing protein [Nocardioides sp. KR10-350]|uniref:DUF3180 domain-containing protein n=1 Tax=Nocardioides cheoyonin TaxID=3156615 RepID=UPI0032B5B00B